MDLGTTSLETESFKLHPELGNDEDDNDPTGGFSPCSPNRDEPTKKTYDPVPDYSALEETRPNHLIFDTGTGVGIRQLEPGETCPFNIVSSFPPGEETRDGDLIFYLDHCREHKIRVVPVPLRLGANCRIPFSHEGTLPPEHMLADSTTKEGLESSVLIDSTQNLVIRGLLSDYQDLEELRGFVTNVGDSRVDLAGIESCTFRVMRWDEIPDKGFPFCRYILSSYCVCDEHFSAKVAEVDRKRIKRMVRELSDTEEWKRSQSRKRRV